MPRRRRSEVPWYVERMPNIRQVDAVVYAWQSLHSIPVPVSLRTHSERVAAGMKKWASAQQQSPEPK